MIYRHASDSNRAEAACLPEEEGEEIPTSQETTVREYSATDLVKQSGRQGGASWGVATVGYRGRWCPVGSLGCQKWPVSARPALQQI